MKITELLEKKNIIVYQVSNHLWLRYDGEENETQDEICLCRVDERYPETKVKIVEASRLENIRKASRNRAMKSKRQAAEITRLLAENKRNKTVFSDFLKVPDDIKIEIALRHSGNMANGFVKYIRELEKELKTYKVDASELLEIKKYIDWRTGHDVPVDELVNTIKTLQEEKQTKIEQLRKENIILKKQLESNQGGLRFEDWNDTVEQEKRVWRDSLNDFVTVDHMNESCNAKEVYSNLKRETKILCHAPKQEEWYVGKKTRTDEVPDEVTYMVNNAKGEMFGSIYKHKSGRVYVWEENSRWEELFTENEPIDIEMCVIVENPEQSKKAEIEKEIKDLEQAKKVCLELTDKINEENESKHRENDEKMHQIDMEIKAKKAKLGEM